MNSINAAMSQLEVTSDTDEMKQIKDTLYDLLQIAILREGSHIQRKVGDIQLASSFEDRMDQLYNKLPEWARWQIMFVVHWKDIQDPDGWTAVSCHTRKDLAEKKARKVGSSLIVYCPETNRTKKYWTVLKPR